MSVKYALLFGTGGFVIVALPSYWSTLNSLHSLIYGAGVFFILSLIGFMVGHILMHPKGGGRSVITRFFKDLFTLAPANVTVVSADRIHHQPAMGLGAEPEHVVTEAVSPSSSGASVDKAN